MECFMDDELLYMSAPGKINLFLKVTGKRPDNYHTLESLFVPLSSPADDIAIDLAAAPGTITVGSSDIMLPGGMGNIAGRAAELWSKRACVMPHWDINIVKNIPVAAGMGGGSSDAAAVLKLLNDHAGKPLDDRSLAETALELGADVPFFLKPEPAMMSGIGEIAEDLDFVLPEMNLLLLAPQFPVSAAEGYRLMLPGTVSPLAPGLKTDLLNALRTADLEKISALIFNDLQPGVFNKYPILEILAQRMTQAGAMRVLMTGSGPTLFGIFADSKSRAQAQSELQAAYPEYRIIPAEF
ncbi:MAG: 4-(cytidine 5'-diphospho)-2-C-methyl-D-erythritol kinase [Lentisphaerae bacterium]|nr:4-(cytidine 5'-diphospho)-2-C-methyl-D-erythritol kinase [Lentisphaerota bacterium]